jgi:phospholipase A1
VAAAGAAGAASTIEECRDIGSDAQRLACYDRAAGRPASGAVGEMPPAPVPEQPPASRGSEAGDFVGRERSGRSGSGLGYKWELADDTRFGVLRLRTHKPNYFLLARWSDNPNQAPFEELLAAPGGVEEWSNTEAKF